MGFSPKQAKVRAFLMIASSSVEFDLDLTGLSEQELGRIGCDLRMRLAHLVGIHKGVRTLFTDPGIGYAWIREPGEHFSGRSALDLMLRGEMVDLAYVRDWIGAEIGA